ncbi:acyl-CoA synthetase [Bosea sp. (in: a-proteobacteria)]|uniref:acyl-CoA synthetase n=1 Tax=Bosea sp. (in: a-proteobacteria) TaxID=1871050 RepID=UPI001ACC91AA|nr:acyl-CoA synthetase [Bosea sp. (in: a-proteobacteria)]MBN9438315.1 acyl-CoA synthetase [Bosea sp. (in: a-proteobacteria)]
MTLETYSDVTRAFSWSAVSDQLGWRPGEKVSLGAAIVDRHADSDRTALIAVAADGRETRLSYRELSQASNRFANLLSRLGVRPGDRVAGLLPRGPEVLIAMIGALKLGAIYVPVFTGFGPDAVAYRLSHSEARVLVTHRGNFHQLPARLDGVAVVAAGSGGELPAGFVDFETGLAMETPEFEPLLRDRDDPAAIIYTSGSTGQPKGGTLAVNFLAATWPYIIHGLDVRPDDVLWATGDPGWGYGFVCYLGALARGALVVSVQKNPTAELCLSVLEGYRVTNMATTPTVLRSLLTLDEQALRAPDLRLRAMSSCGEPLNGEVVQGFRRLWNVTPMDHFGATEYGLPIGNHNAIAMEVRAGSMGLPCPGYRMAIVDEDGVELPAAGAIGFIAKRADADCRYWLRYWNDAAASAALVRNGWIVTGDLGRRDEDGYFWFEGRSDDMIKSSGYRIGPFEVESALLTHPAVAEAAVIGQPDAMRGQVVKAVVVLRPGHVGSDSLTDELVETVKRTVGKHQFPRIVQYVDALPKTETGKIQRFALRAAS